MRATYVATLVLLILAGVFLANFLSLREQKSFILRDQTPPFESLLPQKSDSLVEVPTECSPLCAQQAPVWNTRPVPEPTPPPVWNRPTPPQVPKPDALTVQAPSPVAPVSQPPDKITVPAPVSYIYFYTGVPVRSVPTVPMSSAIVYTKGVVPAVPSQTVSVSTVPVSMPPVLMTSMPTVQSYGVPVFFPRVVPSRVGASKWVYSNGVVIKPKVYYPHQPVRNSLRGVTP